MSNILEIGPGRGDFLFHLATENPFSQVFAIEYKQKRFDKLVKRVETRGLTNIQLYFGDARAVLPEKFSDASLDQIYILFSDPWPKRRHEKHRLFQSRFIEEIYRILKPHGKIFVAHDDPNYLKQIRSVFSEYLMQFSFDEEGVQFNTFYAEKWKKEGRALVSFSYQKLGCRIEKEMIGVPCVDPTIEND